MSPIEWLELPKVQLALAGLAGAVVSSVVEWDTWTKFFRKSIVGTLVAYNLGPIGVPLFTWAFFKINVPSEHALAVGGFLVGVTGMIIIEMILKLAKLRLRNTGVSQ